MFRLDTPTARLRTNAFLEGVSYLVLLLIAMPLKYMADMPLAVRICGSLHGALFVWLMAQLWHGWRERDKSFGWAVRLGLASLVPFLVPFGTFFFDGQLKADDEEYRARAGARAGAEAHRPRSS